MSLMTEGSTLRVGPSYISKEERSTIYYLFPPRLRAYRKRKASQKVKGIELREAIQTYMYLSYTKFFIVYYKCLLKCNVSNDFSRKKQRGLNYLHNTTD